MFALQPIMILCHERFSFHCIGNDIQTIDSYGVIPCQINQFFAKFATPPSDFYAHLQIMRKKNSVQIFSDVGQAVSEI